MPGKNIIKQYVKGGFYHIYNRGVDKRTIFEDEQDYAVFLRFLKEYLLPPTHPDLEVLRELAPRRTPINCSADIDLLAYCLMLNHFHLLAEQKTQEGLKGFMRALLTNYSMYFNHKYERVGPLFQGRYKAVLIQSEPYFLHISRYIHTNPRELLTRDGPLQDLQDYPYSSYPVYLGQKKCEWVKPDKILAMFEKHGSGFGNSYQEFVEEDNADNGLDDILGDLKLE